MLTIGITLVRTTNGIQSTRRFVREVPNGIQADQLVMRIYGEFLAPEYRDFVHRIQWRFIPSALARQFLAGQEIGDGSMVSLDVAI